jgi:hypothetical protein
MTDPEAAALAAMAWESDRRQAAMGIAQQRADAAERKAQEEALARREAEHPQPDPDYLAFMARQTGQPEPLTLAETLAKHQLEAPAEKGPWRDPGAEYGSEKNPVQMINGEPVPEPVPEPVRRSAGLASEHQLQRMLDRSRDNDLWMTEYLVRHDYEGTVARARAKADRGDLRRSGGGHGTISRVTGNAFDV